MAYTPLDLTKPAETTQGITAYSLSIRDNDAAIIDQLLTVGTLPGWDMTTTYSTGKLTQAIFSYSASVKVKVTMTYDGSNRLSTFKAEKTTDGSTYFNMTYNSKYLATFAYNGDSTLNTVTWS